MKRRIARPECQCELCKNEKDIHIPADLVAELLEGNVTVFAGAGISTESRTVLKQTFYEEILSEVGPKGSGMSFPDLMEQFCSMPNGRIKLIQRIASRFEGISAFPETDRVASRFHREISTFYPLKNIITTNWDTYFETICKATPFVTHADLAFWEGADRRALKIHGSIANYGSIVATSKDYAKCKKALSTSVMGSVLKSILATQTVIFVGYSLSDSDFNYIYGFVKKQMQGMHRQAYVVTPFAQDADRFRNLGLIPLITDGAYFFTLIKAHAVSSGVMLPDDIYESAFQLLQRVSCEHRILHETFDVSKNPEIIYAASYQDGLTHALERALNLKGTGAYSNPNRLRNVWRSYVAIQKEKRAAKKYEDVAYIEGYINGLILFLCEDSSSCVSQVPLYFAFGVDEDMFSVEDYRRKIKIIPQAHKLSYQRACDYVKRLNVGVGVEFHHPAWL
jgi:NAD-dependent SIR2 family protein deacetylase